MAQTGGEIVVGDAVLVRVNPAVRGVVLEREEDEEGKTTLRVLAPKFRSMGGKKNPPGVIEVSVADLPKTKRQNPVMLEDEEEIQEVVKAGRVNTAWLASQLRKQEQAGRGKGRGGGKKRAVEPRSTGMRTRTTVAEEEDWLDREGGYEGGSESEESHDGRPGSSKDNEGIWAESSPQAEEKKGRKRRRKGKTGAAGDTEEFIFNMEESSEGEGERRKRRKPGPDKRKLRRKGWNNSDAEEEGEKGNMVSLSSEGAEWSSSEESNASETGSSSDDSDNRMKRWWKKQEEKARKHAKERKRRKEGGLKKEMKEKQKKWLEKELRKRERKYGDSDSATVKDRKRRERERETYDSDALGDSSSSSSDGFDFKCCFQEGDTRGARQERWRLKGEREDRKWRRKALRSIYERYRRMDEFVKERIMEAKEEGTHRPFHMDVLWLKHTAHAIDQLLPGSRRGAWKNWNELVVDGLTEALLELVVRISPKKRYPDCLEGKVRKWMGKRKVGANETFGPVPEFMRNAKFRDTGVITEKRDPFRKERGWGGGRGALPFIHKAPFSGQQGRGRGRGGATGGQFGASGQNTTT